MAHTATLEPEQLSFNFLFEEEDAKPVASPSPRGAMSVTSLPETTKAKACKPKAVEAAVHDPWLEGLIVKITEACKKNSLPELLKLVYGESTYINSYSMSSHSGDIYRLSSDGTLRYSDSGFRYRWNREYAYSFNLSGKEDNVYEAAVNFLLLRIDATPVLVPVVLTFERINPGTDWRLVFYRVTAMTTKKPVIGPKRAPEQPLFPQSEGERLSIIRDAKPYIASWIEEKGICLDSWMRAPWLETLSKAGYRFADDLLLNRSGWKAEEFNLLCGGGSRPKDILKTSPAVAGVLKNCKDLKRWNIFRKLFNKTPMNKDVLQDIFDRSWDTRTIEKINAILAKRHEGRPVFSWTSLVNYLRRLDMYEALSEREAIPILSDYLNMCSMLNLRPRTDGDSLKREHDVAARLCREVRNQKLAEKMRLHKERVAREIAEGNRKLARCEYAEGVFFIRAVRDYDDLLDEAKQQNNCVASYADRIAEGQTRIFFMRETAHPDKSLVTVELSPDCRTIRQALLAHNHRIHNKAMTDFLGRWLKHINSES